MKQLHKPLANATDRIKISSKGSKFFIAVLIGGLATFFCSILLIQGIRKVKLVKVLTISCLLHHYIIALYTDVRTPEQNNLDVSLDC